MSISRKLKAFLSKIDDDNTVLIKSADLVTASNLKAALLDQARIYDRLSTLSPSRRLRMTLVKSRGPRTELKSC